MARVIIERLSAACARVRPSLGAVGARLSSRKRRERKARLRQEVGEQLPVLPVLAGQLQETASHIERAVVETCASFHDMATRAEESVTRARAAMGSGKGTDDETSLDAVVATAQQTLEQLLQRGMRSAELSMQAAARVEEAERAMARIAETTKRVDSIAFGIKLLALNAKIEAVHVGQRGAGFGVVADEIARHAEDSTHVADDIRATVETLMQGVRETRQTLRELASTDTKDVELSRNDVQRALQILSSTNAKMHASVGEAAETSRALASAIATAVTGLQFQDRVNQRLAHVVAALGDVHSALSRAAGDGGEPPDAASSNGALARLESRYTMAEERRTQLAATGTDGPVEGEGSIELF